MIVLGPNRPKAIALCSALRAPRARTGLPWRTRCARGCGGQVAASSRSLLPFISETHRTSRGMLMFECVFLFCHPGKEGPHIDHGKRQLPNVSLLYCSHQHVRKDRGWGEKPKGGTSSPHAGKKEKQHLRSWVGVTPACHTAEEAWEEGPREGVGGDNAQVQRRVPAGAGSRERKPRSGGQQAT